MKTFLERIEEHKNNCKTIKDWEKAYDWLAEEACDINDNAMRMEHAIVEKYGEAVLDELIAMAQDVEPDINEENYTPAMLEMLEYGYKKTEVTPLDKDSAISFFEKGCKILLLSPDNTEKAAVSKEEILKFAGLVGISIEEVAKKMAAEAGFFMDSETEKE